MSDRFNSSGSFTVSVPMPSPSTPTPVTPTAAAVGSPELAHPFALDTGVKGKKDKGSAKDSGKSRIEKDFEGNRFGVSPMALGLILGVGLIAFGITQCKKEDFPQFGSSSGEIREYKRYIQRSDLPGR
jgi:hypothetical protein